MKIRVTLLWILLLSIFSSCQKLVYDKNWNEIKRVAVNKEQMNMPKGKSSLVFSCLFDEVEDTDKYATVEFKTVGEAKVLTATRKKDI